MKIVLTLSFILIVLAAAIAGADSKCDEACLHRRSLDKTLQRVAEKREQGPDCPPAGQKITESKTSFEGGLLAAQDLVMKLNAALAAEGEPLRREQKQCGSCKQLNVVSPVAVSRPLSTLVQPSCDTYGTETLRGDFQSQDDAIAYVEQTLRGSNADGQKLYAFCPNPCSFFSYNAKTDLAHGRVRLNLVVRCGQPKNGLFAKYLFSGALVHEWSCVKP